MKPSQFIFVQSKETGSNMEQHEENREKELDIEKRLMEMKEEFERETEKRQREIREMEQEVKRRREMIETVPISPSQSVCGGGFGDQQPLLGAVKPTSPQNTEVFSCPACMYAFTSRSFLLKHIKKSHSDLDCQEIRNVRVASAPCEQTTSYGNGYGQGDTDQCRSYGNSHRQGDTDQRSANRHPESLSQTGEVQKQEDADQQRSYSKTQTAYKRKRHICKQCGKLFNLLDTLKAHQRKEHTGKRTYNRKRGDKGLKRKPYRKMLRDGQIGQQSGSSLTGNKPGPKPNLSRPRAFPCSLCPNVYTSQVYLHKHLRLKHDNGRSSLTGHKLGTKTNLSRPRAFPCSLCPNVYTSQVYLHKHLRLKHDDLTSGDITSASCQGITSPLTGHTQEDEDRTRLYSHQQSKILTQPEVETQLFAHTVEESDIRKQSDLNTPTHTHTGENISPENSVADNGHVFPCPMCTFAFASRVYLYKHMKKSHNDVYCRMLSNGEITSGACQEIPSSATSQKHGDTDQQRAHSRQQKPISTQPGEVKTRQLSYTTAEEEPHIDKQCDQNNSELCNWNVPQHSAEDGSLFLEQSSRTRTRTRTDVQKQEDADQSRGQQTKTGKVAPSRMKRRSVCNECGKQFNLLRRLKKHQLEHRRRHTRNNTEQGDKSLNQLDILKGQHRLHPVEKASNEPSPEGSPEGFLFLDSSKTQVFNCSVCTYAFASQAYLEKHLKRSHNDLYWKIVWNRQGTSADRQVTPRPSTSQRLGDTDQRNKTLAQTRQFPHTGNTPRIGEQRDSDSSVELQLYVGNTRQHIHTGERHFNCNECDRGFEDLRRHHQHQHGVSSLQASPVALPQSPQEKFSCGECPYAFVSRDIYHAHLKSSHTDLYWDLVRKGYIRTGGSQRNRGGNYTSSYRPIP